MSNPSLPPMIVGTAVIAVVAAALYYVAKKGVAGATAGVVKAAGDAAGGVVVGIGQVLGIPATDETACEKAKREGRRLDASFYCTAGDFLGWSWEGLIRSEGASTAPAPDTSTTWGTELTPDPAGMNWGA